MASRPFQFLEKKRSKIRKRAAKHFEGLAALSTHSTGRRAAVKTGCKPVHFSLDGCPLSCYFPGVATAGTLCPQVGRRTRDGGFHTTCRRSLKPARFLFIPIHKKSACFPTGANGAQKHRTPFPSATPAGITHYTLLRKSLANGGFAPFENPQ